MKNNIGEYIKAERLRYKDGNDVGISQIDLSLKIGWENPSTLSRIEQGRIVPTKETVIKIFEALEVHSGIINFILMKNLYLYSEPLDHDYVNKILKELKPYIDKLFYPAFISFFPSNSLEINLYMNKIALMVLIGNDNSTEFSEAIFSQDILEITSDRNHPFSKLIINREEFLRLMISNIHIAYNDTHKEREYVGKLMKYPDFNRFWEESKNKDFSDFKLFNIPFVYNSPLVGEISFFIQKIPVLEDARFFIQQFSPSTKEDFIKLENIRYKINEK